MISPVVLHGAPAMPLAAVQPMANQIGIAAAVRGTVKISNQSQVGKIVSSGEAIFLGDEVSTDEKSNLQILLLDETIFTIGPSSAIVIDKFIYDPATHDGEVKAKIVKGVFRFVTGKIGQKKPQQMEVDLPSGTIGIRGTIVVGESVGQKSLVALLGPGDKNNTHAKHGSFVLKNGNSQQTVSKTGFGSTIDGNNPPSSPFKVPADQLNKITSVLGAFPDSNSGSEGDEGGDGESATEQAGQDTAEAGEFAMDQDSLGDLFGDLGDESEEASQGALQDDLDDLFGADGFTTWDDIANAPDLSGIHHYYSSSNFTISDGTHITGDASFDVQIDFTAGVFGGGSSNINGSMGSASGHSTCSGCFANGTFTFPIAGQSFGFGDDLAEIELTDVAFTSGDGCGGNCDVADINVNLLNAAGNVAQIATVVITVKDDVAANTPTEAGDGVGTGPLS